MSRRFFTLDVFADTPLAGNPLAVVLDAEGLNSERMQRIAREFNLSETVFVLPPEDPHHRARIRIFTPGMEMPFAGHPTVGTALLLPSLEDMKHAGYGYAIIGGVGPADYYAKAVGAVAIEGSDVGIYRGLLGAKRFGG